MRWTIKIANIVVFVFGLAASWASGFSVGAILGTLVTVAAVGALVATSWETFQDTAYLTFRTDAGQQVLLRPRNGTFSDGTTPANFWKWAFGKK